MAVTPLPTSKSPVPQANGARNRVPEAATEAGATATEKRPPAITRGQFVAILVMAVGLFLFAGGTIWSRAWDLGSIDKKILWTYAVIPVLVLVALLWNRRLSLLGFFLPTLELVCLKFAITYLVASTIWILSPPERRALGTPETIQAEVTAPPPPAPAPAPSLIAASERVDISGVVRDASRKPVPNALVYVAQGLESFVFAPPAIAINLEQHQRLTETSNAHLPPSLIVPSALMTGQHLRVANRDSRLHTLSGHDKAKNQVFNFSLPASANGKLERDIVLDKAYGWVDVACRVHPTEPPLHLLVMAHPYFAWSNAQGEFTLSGVPKQASRVEAALPMQIERAEPERPATTYPSLTVTEVPFERHATAQAAPSSTPHKLPRAEAR